MNAIAGLLFARFAKAIAIAKGDPMQAAAYSEAQQRTNLEAWMPVTGACKALIDPVGATAYAGSLGAIYNDFAQYLRPRLLIGKLAGLRRLPFETRTLVASTGATAAWVGAGDPIPATYGGFQARDALALKKVAAIAILTSELVRTKLPGSEDAILADVGNAIVEQMDRAFIDPSYGATTTRPASITHDATVRTSAGTSIAAIDADLQAMVATLVSANMPLESAAWILHPQTAVQMSLIRGTGGDTPAYPGLTVKGGTLAGLPVVTSQAMYASGSPTEKHIALVEASEINVADDGEAEVSFSSAPALQMDSAPSAGAQQLISLWQSGLMGIRAIRYCNWQVRRTGAVAILDGVQF